MKKTWKFVWDILAVIIGFFIGYKIFIFSGEQIPFFGYIPIGLLLGLLVLGIVAYAIHFLEFYFCWIIFKLFKIKIYNDLPF